MGGHPWPDASGTHQEIDSNWAYEGQQAVDDLDSFLLLRPSSDLTMWDAR